MNKHITFLLFVIIICSLLLVKLVIRKHEYFSETQKTIVVVYEKASPKNCGEVLTFSDRVIKYPIQFTPETIEVADGYVVYLYSHPDTENSYAILTKGSYNFSNTSSTAGVLLKDRIYLTIEYESLADASRKTLKIKECKIPALPIVAYEHCGYQGRAITLAEGRANGGFLNRHKFSNKISSIRIPNGTEAILYDGDNFNGASKSFKSNVSCLNGNHKFNDKASSIEIKSSKSQIVGKLTSSLTASSQYIVVYDSANYKGHYIYIPVIGSNGENISDLTWNITLLKWDQLKKMGMPQGGNISMYVPHNYIVLLLADSRYVRYSQHVINAPGIDNIEITSNMNMYIYHRKT